MLQRRKVGRDDESLHGNGQKYVSGVFVYANCHLPGKSFASSTHCGIKYITRRREISERAGEKPEYGWPKIHRIFSSLSLSLEIRCPLHFYFLICTCFFIGKQSILQFSANSALYLFFKDTEMERCVQIFLITYATTNREIILRSLIQSSRFPTGTRFEILWQSHTNDTWFLPLTRLVA